MFLETKIGIFEIFVLRWFYVTHNAGGIDIVRFDNRQVFFKNMAELFSDCTLVVDIELAAVNQFSQSAIDLKQAFL